MSYEDLFNLKTNPFRLTPAVSAEEIYWAGFPDIKAQFEKRIKRSMKIPNSTLVLNWGEYGSGKTHAARYFGKSAVLAQLANESNSKIPYFLFISLPKGKSPIEDFYISIIDKIDIQKLRDQFQESIDELLQYIDAIVGNIHIKSVLKVINLMYIDTDDFLNRKMQKISYNICKIVSDEIHKHAYDRLKKSLVYPIEEAKRISLKVNYFRERIYYPEDYLDLREEISVLTQYSKNNGEFHSVLLSFYLFRNNNIGICFFTDDHPAKTHFLPYFQEQGIGEIQDLVDLLYLLYELNEDFTTADLKKYLSSLFYEIASELKSLEKDINSFQIPKNQIRNKKFKKITDELRKAISILDLNRVQALFWTIMDNHGEYGQLYSLLIKYKQFFEQNISYDYFDKIRNQLDQVA